MSTTTISRIPWDLLIAVGSIASLCLFCLGAVFTIRFARPEQLFAPNPSIDTIYASAYTEARFDAVTHGMTSAEVVRLVGAPLHTREDLNGGEIWQYTDDGASPVWDFAWLVREVYVNSNGNVTRVLKDIRYD